MEESVLVMCSVLARDINSRPINRTCRTTDEGDPLLEYCDEAKREPLTAADRILTLLTDVNII